MPIQGRAGLDRRASILLVDDSPAILALLKDLLRAHGYADVRTADSVEGGLAAVAEKHPDVIFLDLMMPDTSGIEFTRAALAESPKSRIVLTTALPPTHEAVTMAVSHGASEYLPKPLRDDTLTTVLHHLEMDRSRGSEPDIGYY